MVLNKVVLQNFVCYYGTKSFEFSDGLNIILGENTEGKTKFFDAIKWVINDHRFEGKLYSLKAASNLALGGNFTVEVKLFISHEGDYFEISKNFQVTKESEIEFETSTPQYKVIRKTKNGEAFQESRPYEVINSVFPTEYRRYSLFEGEKELNIFKNNSSLRELINLFSDSKYYESYALKSNYLVQEAYRAVQSDYRKNQKNTEKFDEIQQSLDLLTISEAELVFKIKAYEKQIESIDLGISEAEKFVESSELYESNKKKLDALYKQKAHLYAVMKTDFLTPMFDEFWILIKFKPFYDNFLNKIRVFDTERQRIQTDFDIKKGVKKGKIDLHKEIIEGSVPLPLGVPTQSVMEEMLNEQICKVCNRTAKKGTEEYEFMKDRLKKYLDMITPDLSKIEEDEEEIIFQYNYLSRLNALSMVVEPIITNKSNSIRDEITQIISLNDTTTASLELIEEEISTLLDEQKQILTDSNQKEGDLTHLLNQFTRFSESKSSINASLKYETEKLEGIRKKIKENEEELAKYLDLAANLSLTTIHTVLRDVYSIINETRKLKFDEFLELLVQKSNEIFGKINVDNFKGLIKLIQVVDNSRIDVVLVNSDDSIVEGPSTSLVTSMHISILFAIAELSREKRNGSYPLIFDAPTSSFGEVKTRAFLNILNEIDVQKIVLLKDFIEEDTSETKHPSHLKIKSAFKDIKRNKAMWVWIDKNGSYDKQNQSTIETNVTVL